MTSPFSANVLGASVLVASPALYNSLVTATLPLDVGLIRFLIAFVICWLAIGVLTEFTLPASGRQSGSSPDTRPGGDAAAPAPTDATDTEATVAQHGQPAEHAEGTQADASADLSAVPVAAEPGR